MNKYDRIIDWLNNHWLTAAAILFGLFLMSLPALRDGINLLWSIIRPLPPRHLSHDSPVVIHRNGETITFTELFRSSRCDIVKIHAYTYILGLVAEYEWMKQRYPELIIISRGVASLDMLTGSKINQNESVLFDVFLVKLANGVEKEIMFDISAFCKDFHDLHIDDGATNRDILKKLYGSHSPILHRG